MISNKYSVNSRIAALENSLSEHRHETASLRAEVAAHKALVESLIGMDKRAKEYVSYLQEKVKRGQNS
jgi:hypothetical protein